MSGAGDDQEVPAAEADAVPSSAVSSASLEGSLSDGNENSADGAGDSAATADRSRPVRAAAPEPPSGPHVSETLRMSHVFGLNASRRNNIHYADGTTLVFAAGNTVQVVDLAVAAGALGLAGSGSSPAQAGAVRMLRGTNTGTEADFFFFFFFFFFFLRV